MSKNSHLPDYRSKENGVLYIIGNGFDLYHGLHTSYKDFRDWLETKDPDFKTKLESIYPKLVNGELELWKDFEKALGHSKDSLGLHQTFGDDRNASLPTEKEYTYAAEQIRKVLDKVCPYLKEWAESFDSKYSELKKLLPLGSGSKYITFNYTEVLEKVYQIEGDDTVCHIHGSVTTEQVIIGYEYSNDSQPVGNFKERLSQIYIKSELERFRKPTESVFKDKRDFINKLGPIKTIIIIGHSLADVDLPYIKFLLNELPDYSPVKWQYWIHNEEAKKKAQKRIEDLCYMNSDIENKMNAKYWEYHVLSSV